MTLEEFIKTFDGGTGHTVLTVATSTKKYCYQEKYDIFALPWWVEGEKERQKLIEMHQRSKKKGRYCNSSRDVLVERGKR